MTNSARQMRQLLVQLMNDESLVREARRMYLERCFTGEYAQTVAHELVVRGLVDLPPRKVQVVFS